MRPRLLIVDNYDSFTYNLVQIVENHGNWVFDVIKNDKVQLEEVGSYDKILFSPGPGLPSDAGIMAGIIKSYDRTKIILGVCLGLQAIIESYGGRLINLPKVYHGIKQRIRITDRGEAMFKGIPDFFEVGLYHSWAVEKDSLPAAIKITALSDNGIVMAVSHQTCDVKGVQFHPESYMTEHGHTIISNWLNG
jgi:anthranilate synthase component II